MAGISRQSLPYTIDFIERLNPEERYGYFEIVNQREF